MPASPAHKLTVYIVGLASLSIDDLAQQYLLLGDRLLEIRDGDRSSAADASRMLDVIDAIGECRFPNEWEAVRDGVGYRQEAAS